MTMTRGAAVALVLAGFCGQTASAATCDLTVQGAQVLDDAACAIARDGRTTRVSVDGGATLLIRRSMMSARFPDMPAQPRRGRVHAVSYGQIVRSNGSDDRICYFNQTAVLCVAR